MSANQETKNGWCGESEEVRKVFAALPLDQRLSTLLCVQADIVVDVVENIASAASKALDDLARACTPPADVPPPSTSPSPDNPTA